MESLDVTLIGKKKGMEAVMGSSTEAPKSYCWITYLNFCFI